MKREQLDGIRNSSRFRCGVICFHLGNEGIFLRGIIFSAVVLVLAFSPAQAGLIKFEAEVEIVVPPSSTVPGLTDGRIGTLTYEYDSGLLDQHTTGLTGPSRGDYLPVSGSIDFGGGDFFSTTDGKIQIFNKSPFFSADSFFLQLSVNAASVKTGLFSSAFEGGGLTWLLRGNGSDSTSIVSDALLTSAPILSEFTTNTVSFNMFTSQTASGKVNSVDAVELTSIPEPSTIIMLLTGCVGLVGYGWRRKKQLSA